MKIRTSKEHYFGLSFIATSVETNGEYFLAEAYIPAGDQGPPPHTHSHEDESFYLLEGQIDFTVEGSEFALNAGDFLNILRGEKHTWRNKTKEDARVLITFTPGGIENMFMEFDQNPQKLDSVAKKFGTLFEI